MSQEFGVEQALIREEVIREEVLRGHKLNLARPETSSQHPAEYLVWQ